MPIAIIVHGGAGTVSPERLEIVQEGCKEASLVGWRILEQGGSALDAVEAAVRALEDNPNYNAGTGACLSLEGNIEMDAGLMEGHTLRVGAVAGVELIKNPITLSRHVLESSHVLLAGRGAQEFALEQGMSLCTLEELITERQYTRWKTAQIYGAEQAEESEDAGGVGKAEEAEEPRYYLREVGSLAARKEHQEPEKHQEERHGTVGAVAIDSAGLLAAATSTGGMYNKYPGRVGDSPLVGCGFYADDNAAVSCTGHGEDFIRLLIAKRAADFVAGGANAQEAAEAAVAVLGAKATGTGGLIIVDRQGQVGFAFNSRHLAQASMREGMQEPEVGV